MVLTCLVAGGSSLAAAQTNNTIGPPLPPPKTFSSTILAAPPAVALGPNDRLPVIQPGQTPSLRQVPAQHFLEANTQLLNTYNSAGLRPASQPHGFALVSNLPNDGHNEIGLVNLNSNDPDGFGWWQKTGPTTATELGKLTSDETTFTEFDLYGIDGTNVFLGQTVGGAGYVGAVTGMQILSGSAPLDLYPGGILRWGFANTDGGMTADGVSGGDKGAGTINAQGVYAQGTPLLTNTGANVALPAFRASLGLTPYNPITYGAKCDAPAQGGGGTDDTVALNAMFSAIRTANQPFIVDSAGKTCYHTGTLNLTGFNGFAANRQPSRIALRLDCQTNGTPCVDALGSRFIRFDQLYLFGEHTNSPSVGVQIGRISTASADNHTFNEPYIWGYFTEAAVYNFASESLVVHSPFISNDNPAGGTYGWIQDGCNHWNVTSAFVTETIAADTCESFNEDFFEGGWIGGNTPWWIEAVSGMRAIGGYSPGVSGGNSVVLFAPAAGNIAARQLVFDWHFETNPVNVFFLTGAPATTFAWVQGLSYKDHLAQATGAVLARDSNIATARVGDLVLHIEHLPNATVIFDTASAFSVNGVDAWIGSNTGAWVAPASTSGKVCVYNSATNVTACTTALGGATSGATTVQAAAAASGTLTLPAATDTLVGKATTDALTNKTLTDAINQETHVITTNFSSTSVVLATIVGLDQTFTAGGRYSCNGHLHFSTAPTGSNGAQIALTGDGTVSVNAMNFTAWAQNNFTTAPVVGNTSTTLGTPAFSQPFAMTDVFMSAVLNINAGGVIHVQLAENIASGTIAVNADKGRWDCHRAS